MRAMSFLRSRAEQLADYLRDAIVRGQLVEPLPDSRSWSKTLGVSRNTLYAALNILQREGLIACDTRKVIRLLPQDRRHPKSVVRAPRVVRVLYYGNEFPDVSDSFNRFVALSEHLRVHDVQLTMEKCSDPRLRQIAAGKERRGDLLFLLSLPPAHQRLFEREGGNALVLGYPAPGVTLPYVVFDLVAAVRHATQTLLRHRFARISLVVARSKAPGFPRMIGAFHAACDGWPHQPVARDVVAMSLDQKPLLTAARQLAARVAIPHGVIVASPVPLGTLATALLERGVSLAKEVELIGIMTSAESVKICPPPRHYPFPVEAHARILTEAAVRFFETGQLPPLQKTLLSDLVEPD